MRVKGSNKSRLINDYTILCELVGVNTVRGYGNTNFEVREILNDFIGNHKRVAIYCYGVHTHMLMADFAADLRSIVCIIDNGSVKNDSDFQIIKDEEIENYNLDGIIVSSFNLMNEIKQHIYERYESIDVLDIYEELDKRGIHLEKEFYSEGPYQIYSRINSVICRDSDGKIDAMKRLLEEYLYIKDFRLASIQASRLLERTGDEKYFKIHEKIDKLYKMELSTLELSSKNNVLMLCLDGMRRADFFEGKLNKTYLALKGSAQLYTNAYSYSTMTFESLVPAFSENTDQRTNYFLRDDVDSSECRFMKKALDENRFIAIYGEGNRFIVDDSIKYSGNSQTITEQLWDFVLDVDETDNGLFYLHELYESHYSFPNPYTREPIISNGGAMLFDYLSQNNGGLRTDYSKQQEDALAYLDDTLEPFVRVMPCNMVLFADHGNLVLEPDTVLDDVNTLHLSASEDWIRIPLAIKIGNGRIGEDNELISLLDFNDIMLAALAGEEYVHIPKDYIKIGRSPLYNQQFKELFRVMAREYNGEAFEGFVFANGYKLIVYSNGKKELYKTENDYPVKNRNLIDELYKMVENEITIL